VERNPVIETALGELRDALDVAGGEVWAQLDDDVAAARKGEGQAVGVGHRESSVLSMMKAAI
jgi:hypothetical protein